jgi:CubicO group peptidase (beta-lactamase class C family)
MVTKTAIMHAYERGLVDLDASINSYLPFHLVNPHFPDDAISLRMLLQHTSSLIDDDPVIESTYTIESGLGDPDMTLEEFIRAYYLENGRWYDAEKNFLNARPGTTFRYSNAAFALLGYILEYVTDTAFNEYCNEHIFTPLGMTSTGWLTTEIDLDNMTVHYDNGTTPLAPYSFATYPDGALKTTTHDYAKFLLAIVNGGSYHGQRILRPSTVNNMLSEKLFWSHENMAVFMMDTRAQSFYGHSGGDDGIFSLVYFNPENDTGVIFFMNSAPYRVDFRIINIMAILRRLNDKAQIY